MKVKLLSVDDEASYYHSTIENHEKDSQFLPCRALRKYNQDFYGKYINEVVIGIREGELPSNPKGYEEFDKKIEGKLNKKSVKDKLNIITFFGEKTLDLSDLLSFEDINLLSDFEQRYNDHYVSLPFTLKFRQKDYKAAKIFEDIQKSYSDFISTIRISNLLGYVPAYVSFRNLEQYINLYSDNNLSINSHIGELNFIPLMIDFKAYSPDSLKRSLDKLLKLKRQYLNEGFYLFYYGFNPRTPSVSEKRDQYESLAKDFLLAYLGFDIVGGSYAQLQGGGSGTTGTRTAGIFDSNDYKYHLNTISAKEYNIIKPTNFSSQTQYLHKVSNKLVENPEFAINELKKRNEAYNYVQSCKI